MGMAIMRTQGKPNCSVPYDVLQGMRLVVRDGDHAANIYLAIGYVAELAI